MNLENLNFHDLVETRFFLEVEIVKMAAKRRTIDDIIALTNALNTFEKKVAKGARATEENIMFNLKIADAAKNTTLKSLILIITTKLLQHYNDNAQKIRLYRIDNSNFLLEKNQLVLDHIINQESYLATQIIKEHFKRNQYNRTIIRPSFFHCFN